MIDYAHLKNYITADPDGLGLAPHVAAGSDATIAEILNQVRVAVQIDRETIPAHEIFEAIVPAEWASLTAQEKQRVQTILSMGQVNLKGANTRAALAAAFGAGTTTRANLLALQKRAGSVMEREFGAGVSVNSQDISYALRGMR